MKSIRNFGLKKGHEMNVIVKQLDMPPLLKYELVIK